MHLLTMSMDSSEVALNHWKWKDWICYTNFWPPIRLANRWKLCGWHVSPILSKVNYGEIILNTGWSVQKLSVNWKTRNASNLFRGQRTVRTSTPLKIFGLLWKLSCGVWNLSFGILRAQFSTIGTEFGINWCRNCTSRCRNVLRKVLRTQASQQNFDIMLVSVFSLESSAYELNLYERILLIKQCIKIIVKLGKLFVSSAASVV